MAGLGGRGRGAAAGSASRLPAGPAWRGRARLRRRPLRAFGAEHAEHQRQQRPFRARLLDCRAPRRPTGCPGRSRPASRRRDQNEVVLVALVGAQGPFSRWTRWIAVSIVAIRTELASGVAAPRPSPLRRRLGDPGRGRVALAGSQAQRLEHAGGRVEAVAAEPAEQLLGSVADEEAADHQAQEEASESSSVSDHSKKGCARNRSAVPTGETPEKPAPVPRHRGGHRNGPYRAARRHRMRMDVFAAQPPFSRCIVSAPLGDPELGGEG